MAVDLRRKMLSESEQQKQANRVKSCAVSRYGELRRRKLRPPSDQLVLSMLYQFTSVRRATRALRELMGGFADWNEVRISPCAEAAAAMAPTGWALEAAEHIRIVLQGIYTTHGSMSLEFLHELPRREALAGLMALPGVDRPLANEVLLLSLDIPVLPCYRHTARMCWRLGLADKNATTIKNEQHLTNLFGIDLLPPLHLFFCDVGRNVCLDEDPLCKRCPMNKHCPH